VLLDRLRRHAGIQALAKAVADAESWWFDASRHVQTSKREIIDGMTLAGTVNAAQYVPVRAASARIAFRDLPLACFDGYTFIDFGSGRGRVLFLAAEYPFRKVQGVEFALELHRDALTNIRTYRHRRRRCQVIESVHVNAVDFEFAAENQVLFFFNPFPAETLARVLARLRASLEKHPRDVVLMLVYPELAPVCAATPWLRLVRSQRRYRIYRAVMETTGQ
jgi:SAM-dependent methyltransferase